MNKYASDTRITAYIFGELEPDQLQQFESEMQSSPELRREVSETRDTMSWVESQLTEPEELALNSEQTQAIFEASSNDSTNPSAAPPIVVPAKPKKQSEHTRGRTSLRWIGVAACVGLIGATSWAVWQGSQSQLQLAEANQSNVESESLLANSDGQNELWGESKDMLDADELVALAQPSGAPNTDLSAAVADDGVSVVSGEKAPMELKKFAPATVSSTEYSVASSPVENVELRGANASTVRRMAEVELARQDRLLDQRALPLAQQN